MNLTGLFMTDNIHENAFTITNDISNSTSTSDLYDDYNFTNSHDIEKNYKINTNQPFLNNVYCYIY